MPPRSSAVLSVEMLRRAVAKRVGESSLRVVAAEIKMSWKGVDKFLSGSVPRARTIQKLTEWYLRRSAAADEPASDEVIAAALELIVRHLPPAHREEARSAVSDAVRKVGEEHGIPAPSWASSDG